MKRVTSLLFAFVVAYSLLFVLSILFIVPRYLSGSLGDFLLAELMDTEPEGRFVTSFSSALIWMAIPLTAVALCVISMVSYSASTRSAESLKKWGQLGTVLFFDHKCPACSTGCEGATRLPCARNSFSWVPECSERFRSCSERLPQPCISAGTWRSLGCARRHLRRDGALLRFLSSPGTHFC